MQSGLPFRIWETSQSSMATACHRRGSRVRLTFHSLRTTLIYEWAPMLMAGVRSKRREERRKKDTQSRADSVGKVKERVAYVPAAVEQKQIEPRSHS